MDCPTCKIKIACVDSVSTGKNTFRKYHCVDCGKVIYTHEAENEAAKVALGLLREKQRGRNKAYKRAKKDKEKPQTQQNNTSENLRKIAFEQWGVDIECF